MHRPLEIIVRLPEIMLQSRNWIVVMLAVFGLVACSSKPLVPYTTDTPPLVLVPISYAGVADERARFREIFCTVLERHGNDLPDYRLARHPG